MKAVESDKMFLDCFMQTGENSYQEFFLSIFVDILVKKIRKPPGNKFTPIKKSKVTGELNKYIPFRSNGIRASEGPFREMDLCIRSNFCEPYVLAVKFDNNLELDFCLSSLAKTPMRKIDFILDVILHATYLFEKLGINPASQCNQRISILDAEDDVDKAITALEEVLSDFGKSNG